MSAVLHAPLQNVDLQQWVNGCRDGGLSAVDVYFLITELSYFGAISMRQYEDAQSQYWDNLRSRVCDHILKIQNIVHLNDYFNNQEEILTGVAVPQMTGLFKAFEGAQKIKRASSFYQSDLMGDVIGGHEEKFRLMLRMSPLLYKSKYRNAINEHKEKTWDDVRNVLGRQCINVSDAEKMLTVCGLQGFECDPFKEWDVVHFLNRVNDNLQDQTQWQGPVLGLNNSVFISFKSDVSMTSYKKVSGRHTRRTSFTLLQIQHDEMGQEEETLAHEWTHALDYSLSINGCATSREEGRSAYKKDTVQLLSQICSPRREYNEDPFVFLKCYIKNSVSNANQEDVLFWAQQQKLLSPWKMKKAVKHLKKSYPNENFNHLAVVAFINVLHTPSTDPFWLRFSQQFDHCFHVFDKRNTYWNDNTEKMARSFESLYVSNYITNWDNTNINSVCYPNADHAQIHQQYWNKFFNACAPWWNQQFQNQPSRPKI